MDVFSKGERSAIMSRVRGRGNRTTETRLIQLMRAARLTGWRRGVPLLGKPDFVFRAARLVIFVDGCFWHGCPRHGETPASRLDYWVPKLARNARRDKTVTRALKAAGWTVLRIWECDLAPSRAPRTLLKIARALHRCDGRHASHSPHASHASHRLV